MNNDAKCILVLAAFSLTGGISFGFWQNSFSAALFMAIALFMVSVLLWDVTRALYCLVNK